jgi:hypothetical protein
MLALLNLASGECAKRNSTGRAGIHNDLIFRNFPGFPLQFIPRLMRGGIDKACHPFPVEWDSHWEIQHAPCKAEGNLAWLLKMLWKNGLLRG